MSSFLGFLTEAPLEQQDKEKELPNNELECIFQTCGLKIHSVQTLGLKEMNTVYLKRRPTRGEFFVSRDGTRENARSYAVVGGKPQEHGAFALSTRGTHGNAQCHLVPSERRAIGHTSLLGDLLLDSQCIAAISIQHEINAPFIRVESDTVEVLAEREPFRGRWGQAFSRREKSVIEGGAKEH